GRLPDRLDHDGDVDQDAEGAALFVPHHRIRVPGGRSRSTADSPSTASAPAARIIPCEVTPLIVAGLRLARKITERPMSSSGRKASAMPATTWRGSASPTSTVSLSSFLAFGT